MCTQRKTSKQGAFLAFSKDPIEAWYCLYMFSVTIENDPAIYIYFRLLPEDLELGEIHVAKYLPTNDRSITDKDKSLIALIYCSLLKILKDILEAIKRFINEQFLLLDDDEVKHELLPIEGETTRKQLEEMLKIRLRPEMSFARSSFSSVIERKKDLVSKLIVVDKRLELEECAKEIIINGDRFQRLCIAKVERRIKRVYRKRKLLIGLNSLFNRAKTKTRN